MKKIIIVILVLIVVAVGYAFFMKRDAQIPILTIPVSSGDRHETITIEKKGNLGIATTADGEQFLVDKEGMSLYYNTADEGQVGKDIKWSCTSACEKTWSPYLVDEQSISLSPSTDPLLKNLNVFTRSWGDNRNQYALNSKLLYRYSRDTISGDAKGDTGNGWMLARP